MCDIREPRKPDRWLQCIGLRSQHSWRTVADRLPGACQDTAMGQDIGVQAYLVGNMGDPTARSPWAGPGHGRAAYRHPFPLHSHHAQLWLPARVTTSTSVPHTEPGPLRRHHPCSHDLPGPLPALWWGKVIYARVDEGQPRLAESWADLGLHCVPVGLSHQTA